MTDTNFDLEELALAIKRWGNALGFQQVGICDIDLSRYEQDFLTWLARNFHGDMAYMAMHGTKRYRPAELLPGTIRILSARMDYLPADTQMPQILQNKAKGYISRYALGRDYHKLIRKRLSRLAHQIAQTVGSKGYRVFADSAPILEKPIAEKAGLGWIGKHTLLLNRQAGSWFFLGEIFTDLPLPIDAPVKNHCGTCRACLDICPTQAIIGPQQLDARLCISYLTIEFRGSIPVHLRKKIGNRIYGCDDCQIVCPWNRFAKFTTEEAFQPRHQLASANLIDLFAWSEEEFLHKTTGSAIRRIGYECWLRNIAIALGNAPYDIAVINSLKSRQDHPSELVKEHVQWALHNLSETRLD